jgi:TFIIF-interacting CTD phosphatase-like protein
MDGSEDSDSSVAGGTSDDKTSEGGTDVGKKKSEVTLSDAQKKSLENAIQKQKKFMDEEIQKKKLSKKDKSAIDAIDASGMSYKEVGKDLKDRYDGKSKKTKCILVKNLNKTLVDSNYVDLTF